MRYFWLILLSCVAVSFGQIRWTQRARVRHHTDFYTRVMQETIYELERRGFSSLKMTDITQNHFFQMFRWQINATINYTNGFLVSMQKIDVTSIRQSVNTPTVNGVQISTATVLGSLNLRDVKVGYDVSFRPLIGREKRFTGDMTHTLIQWDIDIVKDLSTNNVTVSTSVNTSGGNSVRMVYRPTSNITELMSREFFPFTNSAGFRSWSTVFQSVILDVVKNKVPFPEVCFTHC